MRKRVLIFLVSIFIMFLPTAFAFLGISPAMQHVDFKPGMQLEYGFNVYADPGKKIELYSAGEFSELVNFDKKELDGGGGFSVRIKLPGDIEKPGQHVILVGARERIEEEGGFGTSVAVQAPIIVMVPYPGRYAEIRFYGHSVNVGEPVRFEVSISSMGKEPIFANTRIEIFDSVEKIETLELGMEHIENQKTKVLKKTLNTSLYKPGDYKAEVIVDYEAGVARAELDFRIGHLFVNTTNYTREVLKQGIRPFDIDIESLWNNPLESVYAEVYIDKDSQNVINFQTPSTSLGPWEKKTLRGYLDTDELDDRDYNTKIKLNYAKNYSLSEGKLTIKKKSIMTYVIIATALFLLVISIIVYLIVNKFYIQKSFRKNGKKKSKM